MGANVDVVAGQGDKDTSRSPGEIEAVRGKQSTSQGRGGVRWVVTANVSMSKMESGDWNRTLVSRCCIWAGCQSLQAQLIH